MTALRLFVLAHDQARAGVGEFAKAAPAGTVVEFKEPTRTLEQNSKLWPMLADIAAQVPWAVDGETRLLKDWEWKIILTAGLKKEQHIAMGINGGFVSYGQPTSKMSKREMSELVEFMYWFGAEKGVVWSEPRA